MVATFKVRLRTTDLWGRVDVRVSCLKLRGAGRTITTALLSKIHSAKGVSMILGHTKPLIMKDLVSRTKPLQPIERWGKVVA
jgi:hypothetical protein